MEKARLPCPGRVRVVEIKFEAGMRKNELRATYKFYRRNESSKSWRSRYTPRWKRFLTDVLLKTWELTRVDRLTAISQLAHERTSLSTPPSPQSSQRELVQMHTQFEPKSRLEADLSPSRATATILNAAPDAQNSYTQANQHSGGGRTEEKRDRVNQQQIDRSGISNRTRARGTEIEAGTTSAYGWTAFPAERQGAAIEMRVGQNGGPLPFEAITDFGEPIVYFLYFLHGLQEGRFLQQRRAFFATKPGLRRTRVTIPGVSCNSFHAKGHGGGGGRDGRRCREGLRLGRAVRREDEVKPAPALRFRAERLWAGEAQVEAEGNEVTLPVKEPRAATTL
jgi:hypothetical protein